MQGGADAQPDLPGQPKEAGLVALGSLFYEPVWLFYREDVARKRLRRDTIEGLADLRGWRLNVGPGHGVGAPGHNRAEPGNQPAGGRK